MPRIEEEDLISNSGLWRVSFEYVVQLQRRAPSGGNVA